MKLALDYVLLNSDDQPAEENGKPITLRATLIRSVLSEYDDNMQPVKGEEKFRRYDLYRQLKKATVDTEFDPEDVVYMRKAGLIFAPLVAGQIRDLLT